MEIPYTREEIEEALRELDEMVFDLDYVTEKMNIMQAETEIELPSDEDSMNLKLAEHYGMTVAQVATTRLRPLFLKMYVEYIVERRIERLMEVLNITNVQAWALFLKSIEDPSTDPVTGPTN